MRILSKKRVELIRGMLLRGTPNREERSEVMNIVYSWMPEGKTISKGYIGKEEDRIRGSIREYLYKKGVKPTQQGYFEHIVFLQILQGMYGDKTKVLVGASSAGITPYEYVRRRKPSVQIVEQLWGKIQKVPKGKPVTLGVIQEGGLTGVVVHMTSKAYPFKLEIYNKGMILFSRAYSERPRKYWVLGDIWLELNRDKEGSDERGLTFGNMWQEERKNVYIGKTVGMDVYNRLRDLRIYLESYRVGETVGFFAGTESVVDGKPCYEYYKYIRVEMPPSKEVGLSSDIRGWEFHGLCVVAKETGN